MSDESGQWEVYVQDYPDPTGKWPISTAGGHFPRWARGGRELFYLAEGTDGTTTVMAVAVDSDGPRFSAGRPQALFSANVILRDHGPGVTIDIPYAVSADGQRFLINEAVESIDQKSTAPDRPSLTVVLNWDAGLNP